MPSQLHDALVLLFRNRPELAPDLIRDALGGELPTYTEARVESAELTDIQPAEYRADLVIRLSGSHPVHGIVVEVQLYRDESKRYVWPVYVTGLRARMRCPVTLLVVSPDESVARWAAKPIDLGGANRFTPTVLGPSGVPIITEEQVAHDEPELAVLSAMAHGRADDAMIALRIALVATAASSRLDDARSRLYLDLVWASLSEAARRSLQAMDPAKYDYQSEFAKRWIAQAEAEGRAVGELEGRIHIVLKLLTLKFGQLSDEHAQRIHAASIVELDLWAERVLSASSLDAVFATNA